MLKALLARTIIRCRKPLQSAVACKMLFFLAFFTFTACSGLRDSASLTVACKHKTSFIPRVVPNMSWKMGIDGCCEPWNVWSFSYVKKLDQKRVSGGPFGGRSSSSSSSSSSGRFVSRHFGICFGVSGDFTMNISHICFIFILSNYIRYSMD